MPDPQSPPTPGADPDARAHRGPGELDAAAEVFAAVRPRLLGIAYRMLGSRGEAEDMVQEAWLRWQGTDRAAVTSPPAFLATVITRLCLNHAQSARARRETYVGPWLPEPIDTSSDPAGGLERQEDLELGLLFLLEKLTPTERATYVLRESFGYGFDEIATILELTPTNTRQVLSRARRHLDGERRAPVDADGHRRLLQAFVAAAQVGDLAGLEQVLVEDVVSWTDGNGARLAARRPMSGRSRVAAFTASFAGHFWSGTRTEWVQANGTTGLLVHRDDQVLALLTVSASPEGITQVRWTMAPAKLAAWHRVPDGDPDDRAASAAS